MVVTDALKKAWTEKIQQMQSQGMSTEQIKSKLQPVVDKIKAMPQNTPVQAPAPEPVMPKSWQPVTPVVNQQPIQQQKAQVQPQPKATATAPVLKQPLNMPTGMEWLKKVGTEKIQQMQQQGISNDEIKKRLQPVVDKIKATQPAQQTPEQLQPAEKENTLFSDMQNNVTPTNDGTQPYRNAMQRFAQFNTYNSMDVQQLSSSIASGDLLPGSKVWNDLSKLWRSEDLRKAQQIATSNQNQKAMGTMMNNVLSADGSKSLAAQSWAPLTIENAEFALTQQILKTINDMNTLPTLQETLSSNPEVIKARENARATKEQLDSVTASMNNLQDDMILQMQEAGTRVPSSYFAAKLADQSKPLLRQLETLQMQYNNDVSLLWQITEEAIASFEGQKEQLQWQIQWQQFVLWQVQRLWDIQREEKRAETEFQQRRQLEQEGFDRQQVMEEQKYQRQLEFEELGFDRDMAKMKAQQEFTRDMSNEEYQQELAMTDKQFQQDMAKYRLQIDSDRYSTIEDAAWNPMLFDKTTGKTSQINIPAEYNIWWQQFSLWDVQHMTPEMQEQALIQFAEQNKWLQYKYGGDGKNGIDCSGLLVAFGQATWLLQPWQDMNAEAMFQKSTQSIPLNGLKRWDLVYYQDKNNGKITHVGIAMWPEKNGKLSILDASTNTGWVATREISVKWGDLVGGNSRIIGADNFLAKGGDVSKLMWGQQQAQQVKYELPDITAVNSLTDAETFKQKDNPLVRAIITEKNRIMSDPNSSIDDILYWSSWNKWDVLGSSEQQLAKYEESLWKIWEIQKSIGKSSTGPVWWRLRNINPYDTNAQTVKAQLNALLPWLARWVYGEVWVLTDNDIERYSRTVPNLKSTAEVNEAILAMTIRSIANGYKAKLGSLASAWKDVSWYSGKYKSLIQQAEEIENRLEKWTSTSSQPTQAKWFSFF